MHTTPTLHTIWFVIHLRKDRSVFFLVFFKVPPKFLPTGIGDKTEED